MRQIATLGCFLCGLGAVGQAFASSDVSAELEQVRTDRQQLEIRFDAQDRQCYQKLNVNDCKREVQQARSEALRPLIARQRDLEATLRKVKADEQRAKAQERREAHEQRLKDRSPKADLPSSAPVAPRQP